MKPRIAILASGGGTTAEAFILAGMRGQISAQAALIICSRKNAGIFDRIAALNSEYGLAIPCQLINHHTHPAAENETVAPGCQTMAEEAAIIDAITAGGFDAVALMGYMKRVGPRVVHEFGWRPEYTSPYQACMLNTHPGLLPATKGMYGVHIQQFVLDNRLPEAGQTLHIVAENYDEGPVIAEHRLPVQPGETADELFARVQAAEKECLPGDIDAFIKNRREYLKRKEDT